MLAYTYDSLGRVLTVDNDGTVNVPRVVLPSETISLSYDATNQLTGADYSTTQADESYAYNENGNRTSSTTTAGNRVSSDGTFSYSYDAEGNRTERVTIASPGNKLTYAWDHRNRLTSIGAYVDNVLIKTVYYVYDAFDRRIAEDVDNGGDGTIDRVMTWVYDSEGKRDSDGHPIDDVVLVFDGNGDLQRRYLHGFQADQILAEENVVTGEVTWPLADKQGTIHDRVWYDRSGTPRARFHSHVWYDSFGKIVKQVDAATGLVMATYDAKSYFGAFGPTYGFQGREFEADADLYFFRARWYDYRTGRFLSEDPIFDDTMNTYRFVGNGPTNGRDPSGLAISFPDEGSADAFVEELTRYGAENVAVIKVPGNTPGIPTFYVQPSPANSKAVFRYADEHLSVQDIEVSCSDGITEETRDRITRRQEFLAAAGVFGPAPFLITDSRGNASAFYTAIYGIVQRAFAGKDYQVIADLGGEGPQRGFDGRDAGHSLAININITPFSHLNRQKKTPNLFMRLSCDADETTIPDKSIDVLISQGTPISESNAQMINRIASDGASVRLRGPNNDTVRAAHQRVIEALKPRTHALRQFVIEGGGKGIDLLYTEIRLE